MRAPETNLEAVRQERERALTLLEVTLTLAVLTALALSVALLIVPVARQSRLNRELGLANSEARKVLEQVQTAPFSKLLTDFPPGLEIPVDELPEGKLVVSYADPQADPLIVQVDLVWNSPEIGRMQRSFHTARTE